jgi:hypothetical protein
MLYLRLFSSFISLVDIDLFFIHLLNEVDVKVKGFCLIICPVANGESHRLIKI